TTLFNLITGHLRPDAVQVMLKDRDITGIAPHDLCRLGMGSSFHPTNLLPRLTVFENVQAAYVSHRGRGWSLFRNVDRLYRGETEGILRGGGLHDRAHEESRFLSHGGQKQLELGIALALEPEILLLDEPPAGMSAGRARGRPPVRAAPPPPLPRARHGGGVLDLPAHHRAPPGAHHRRRGARGGPARPSGEAR